MSLLFPRCLGGHHISLRAFVRGVASLPAPLVQPVAPVDIVMLASSTTTPLLPFLSTDAQASERASERVNGRTEGRITNGGSEGGIAEGGEVRAMRGTNARRRTELTALQRTRATRPLTRRPDLLLLLPPFCSPPVPHRSLRSTARRRNTQ